MPAVVFDHTFDREMTKLSQMSAGVNTTLWTLYRANEDDRPRYQEKLSEQLDELK